MTETSRRILAVIKADFFLRFRRPSTAVVFLILCASAYLWIPDPSTGKALIQVNERRALYNSAALAIGTSTIYTLLMGLFGYYLVSNSIKKDIQTRTGFILASTTMRNSEYLIGKFVGNVVFLASITVGFLLSSIIMQLIRGEAPLEPYIFIAHYAVMIPPLLVFISAMAVFFESTRFLSGKFGDVVYFIVWIGLMAFSAVGAEKSGNSNIGSYFDSYGMGYLLAEVRSTLGSDSLAIGSTGYDTTKPPIVISGIFFSSKWIVPRLISLLYPLLFLFFSLVRFHRFNPDRIKSVSRRTGQGLATRINSWLKPISACITAPALRLVSGGKKASFLRSIASEVLVSLQIYPAGMLLIAFFTIFFLLLSPAGIQQKLPFAFTTMVLVLADIASREKNAGTLPTIFASPRLRQNFVLWKLLAAIVLALAFVWIGVLKLLFTDPYGALALICGTIFVAAAATGLGILSSNPKSFIVLFLFFLYLVMNDGGQNSFFDFAGWFHKSTPAILGIYTIISATFIAASETFHRWQLKRSF